MFNRAGHVLSVGPQDVFLPSVSVLIKKNLEPSVWSVMCSHVRGLALPSAVSCLTPVGASRAACWRQWAAPAASLAGLSLINVEGDLKAVIGEPAGVSIPVSTFLRTRSLTLFLLQQQNVNKVFYTVLFSSVLGVCADEVLMALDLQVSLQEPCALQHSFNPPQSPSNPLEGEQLGSCEGRTGPSWSPPPPAYAACWPKRKGSPLGPKTNVSSFIFFTSIYPRSAGFFKQ